MYDEISREKYEFITKYEIVNTDSFISNILLNSSLKLGKLVDVGNGAMLALADYTFTISDVNNTIPVSIINDKLHRNPRTIITNLEFSRNEVVIHTNNGKSSISIENGRLIFRLVNSTNKNVYRDYPRQLLNILLDNELRFITNIVPIYGNTILFKSKRKNTKEYCLFLLRDNYFAIEANDKYYLIDQYVGLDHFIKNVIYEH